MVSIYGNYHRLKIMQLDGMTEQMLQDIRLHGQLVYHQWTHKALIQLSVGRLLHCICCGLRTVKICAQFCSLPLEAIIFFGYFFGLQFLVVLIKYTKAATARKNVEWHVADLHMGKQLGPSAPEIGDFQWKCTRQYGTVYHNTDICPRNPMNVLWTNVICLKELFIHTRQNFTIISPNF